MQNSNALERIKNVINNLNFTIQKDSQNTEDETLKARLNKKNFLVVNNEKLLEKSHYFKSITKLSFADHESEFT